LLQGFARWTMRWRYHWVRTTTCARNNIYSQRNGTARRKYLPDLCSGPENRALASPNRAPGSDALDRCAPLRGAMADYYVLNGGKIYITNGPVARRHPGLRQDRSLKRPAGHFRLHRRKGLSRIQVAQKLTKMALVAGSQTAELVFEDCRVPAENLIAAKDQRTASRSIVYERARSLNGR